MLLKILAKDFWSRTNNEIGTQFQSFLEPNSKKELKVFINAVKLINLMYKMTECLYVIEFL